MTVIPILRYHSVTDHPESWIAPYAVSPDKFIDHLRLIITCRRTPMTVSEVVSHLESGQKLPERPVVLTFDDGFADFAPVAERLAALEMPSTLYVITGALSGREPRGAEAAIRPASWLSWSQLRALETLGVEIGSHSHTHSQLDVLGWHDVFNETRVSAALLEDELGHAITSFAYPHGFHSARTRRAVASAGYRSACAVENALSSDSDEVQALARLTVKADTSLTQVGEWLNDRGAPIAPVAQRLRTSAWRWYRRFHGPGSDSDVFPAQSHHPNPVSQLSK